MKNTISTVDITFISISILGMLFYVFINEYIVWKQRKNPYYKRSKTVRLFSILFFCIAATDIAIISHAVYGISLLFVSASKGAVAFMSILTGVSYLKDVSIFTEKQIPLDKINYKKVYSKVEQKILNSRAVPDDSKGKMIAEIQKMRLSHGGI